MRASNLPQGSGWLDEALALPGPRDAVRARVHTTAAGLAYWGAKYDGSNPMTISAAIYRALRDGHGEMESLYNLGFVPMLRGDQAAPLVPEPPQRGADA
jgi:hypothetical protein